MYIGGFLLNNLGKIYLKKKILIFVFVLFNTCLLFAQVENVSVSHPVYDLLKHFEARGLLPNFSTSNLPLQRKEIICALEQLQKCILTDWEKNTLQKYLVEFEILRRENSVVFYSSSDTTQVLSKDFISNKEKFFFRLKDSLVAVNISPLGSFEGILDNDSNAIYGNLGLRFFGSVGEHFGFFLQATNGAMLNGSRILVLNEFNKMRQNVKFATLNSDFDFSESHVAVNYDWLYASIGRQTRLMGSGIDKNMFISDNSAPQDAITLSSKFKNFEYHYSHSALLATDTFSLLSSNIPLNRPAGFNAEFPDKYFVTHRFAVKPSWGEIAFWEGIIYSKRGFDLAYLNPLSFFKSLEHALHDRDNSLMGGDITIRPYDRLQIKGSFLLDDVRFEEIGKGYWSNKTAWNIGLTYVTPFNTDISAQYSRIEPYTFSHFDSVNSYTNDGMLLGFGNQPNSDETYLKFDFWFGNRYPITLKLIYTRHGQNIYNSVDSLIKNVGGDVFQTRRHPIDKEFGVKFLDGTLIETVSAEIAFGFELVRGFNIKGFYRFRTDNNVNNNIFHVGLFFEDF